MFTVLFAIPRMSGWLAHWHELLGDKDQKISRPRQWYAGAGRARLRQARRSAERRLILPETLHLREISEIAPAGSRPTRRNNLRGHHDRAGRVHIHGRNHGGACRRPGAPRGIGAARPVLVVPIAPRRRTSLRTLVVEPNLQPTPAAAGGPRSSTARTSSHEADRSPATRGRAGLAPPRPRVRAREIDEKDPAVGSMSTTSRPSRTTPWPSRRQRRGPGRDVQLRLSGFEASSPASRPPLEREPSVAKVVPTRSAS